MLSLKTTKYLIPVLSILMAGASLILHAQPKPPSIVNRFAPVKPRVPFLPQDKDPQLFGTGSRFIENIGQYGKALKGVEDLGNINYAFEGFGMPVLLTNKGMIFLQRRVNPLTEEEREEVEKKGVLNKEVEEGFYYTDRKIILEWVGANSNPEIEPVEETANYYTYASVQGKAKGFKKILYKNVYDGIDILFSFTNNIRAGFEYSFIINAGADPSKIKLIARGDTQSCKTDYQGDLTIISELGGYVHSSPQTFYCTGNACLQSNQRATNKIVSKFIVKDGEISFELGNYDKSRTIIIDPFVSSTASLSGMNTGVAKDVDFDYEGNIYVTGGGSTAFNLLSKFDADGNLLWTFNGNLGVPSWSFGFNYGGWVVEKITGKTYLGQGGTSAFRVIRLDEDGLYDNYITDQNSALQENWKMIYNCDGGTPKILIAGGGSANEHINFAICTPPATAMTQLNITGQPTGHQDMSDMVLDPKTNDLYCIFSQAFVTPITENNRLYKHKAPYTPAAKVWTRMSGFSVLNERANRPYLADASGFNDNSINGLAVNSDYLFYYDGFNLMAMSKGSGATAGSPVTFPLNTVLLQGGIIADECNNVYVGSTNGLIKVYKFNGTSFNDAGAPDINIAGFGTASVYDLAYDNAKNVLYACGKGFVAAIDINSYCANAIYTVKVTTDCVNLTASASLTPSLPTGSTVTYALYDGNTLIGTNATGSFTGLLENINYTMKALVDEACGGTQAVKDFMIVNCNAPGIGTGVWVPSGFTPNSDGLNDFLRAVPYGIREFKYFALYNRWGELVFKTTDPLKGWDGTINGKKQDSGVYVWMLEAIDIYDKPIKLKGTTTLIR